MVTVGLWRILVKITPMPLSLYHLSLFFLIGSSVSILLLFMFRSRWRFKGSLVLLLIGFLVPYFAILSLTLGATTPVTGTVTEARQDTNSNWTLGVRYIGIDGSAQTTVLTVAQSSLKGASIEDVRVGSTVPLLVNPQNASRVRFSTKVSDTADGLHDGISAGFRGSKLAVNLGLLFGAVAIIVVWLRRRPRQP